MVCKSRKKKGSVVAQGPRGCANAGTLWQRASVQMAQRDIASRWDPWHLLDAPLLSAC
jgi:hypothetical protein